MSFFEKVIFHRYANDESGTVLNACSSCGRKLFDYDSFLIAKAYQQGRCAMMSVQCVKCQENSQQYASEQSYENLKLYSGRRFREFVEDPIKRKVYHLEEPSCLITGEVLKVEDPFELYCFHLPFSDFDDHDYLLIGPTAVEQLNELISEETRRQWGKYLETLSPKNPDMVLSPFFI